MKKSRLSGFFLIVLMLFSYGCNDIPETAKQQFREIAWESLSKQAKETVTHNVDEASVNLNDAYRQFGEQNAESVPAVSVRFNTTDDALLGPIIIYIDRESKEILGQAARF